MVFVVAASSHPTVPETDSEDMAVQPVANRAVPLTIVIPTLDESVRIDEAVRDLWWADEVIVVDGGSTLPENILERPNCMTEILKLFFRHKILWAGFH